MKNKYNNVKIVDGDGNSFDSKKELRRWNELKLMEKGGEITSLDRQQKFVLIPSQNIDGIKERECSYIADFVYVDKNGMKIVEDVKGMKKGPAYQLFVIKRKLMLNVHGIHVIEI